MQSKKWGFGMFQIYLLSLWYPSLINHGKSCHSLMGFPSHIRRYVPDMKTWSLIFHSFLARAQIM